MSLEVGPPENHQLKKYSKMVAGLVCSSHVSQLFLLRALGSLYVLALGFYAFMIICWS
jgi:hypothetical protein